MTTEVLVATTTSTASMEGKVHSTTMNQKDRQLTSCLTIQADNQG